jgi:hypothetical protein
MKVTKWSGKPITKPGWYSGIPIERYHSKGICDGHAVSSSDLRTCWSKSPAHMFARWAENADREEREVSRNMILGSAAHHLFLGEDGFNLKFIQQPETYPDTKTAEVKPWHNGANYCKDWNAKFEAQGKVIVLPREFNAIRKMAGSLAVDPMVQNGILNGRVEHSGFFKHPTGLWVKVRPDVIPVGSGDYVDLKTAADVTTVALQSSIRSYGYHMQGALVMEAGAFLSPEVEQKQFVLLFIETANPYCARSVPLNEKSLVDGMRQNLAMLEWIAECIERDRWPGPGGDDDVRPLGLSNDEHARIEERLKRGGR